MKRISYGVAVVLLMSVYNACINRDKYAPKPYVRALEIVKLSDSDYMHISYVKDSNGGYIPCNGYIFINNNEALIFDTAINDSLSTQLINFVQDHLGATVKGVVVNHAHKDAAGGLKAFAIKKIPSYASQKTAALLAQDSLYITHPFTNTQEIVVGKEKVENSYKGEAHAPGNIISYIPSSHTIVGGCMVKCIDGIKGNISEANLNTWSQTIQTIKDTYPDVQRVIPGHGGYGDVALLDYTIALFAKEEPAPLNLE